MTHPLFKKHGRGKMSRYEVTFRLLKDGTNKSVIVSAVNAEEAKAKARKQVPFGVGTNPQVKAL